MIIKKSFCPFCVGQDCKICQKIFPKLLKKYSKTNEQTKRNYRYKCPCGVYTIKHIRKTTKKIIKG